MGFARSLQEILGMFNPAHAVSGDAVYTQEALDRIITNLMEANPQSNAAPPASEQALDNLQRRTVNREMLEGEAKTECSICIDDMMEGQTATFLPCHHFFHDECVVLWLREHNTCPVCRAPIEKNEQSEDSGGNHHNGSGGSSSQQPGGGAGGGGSQGGGGGGGGGGGSSAPRYQTYSSSRGGSWSFEFTNSSGHDSAGHERSYRFQPRARSGPWPYVNQSTRPPMPSQSQSRLNEAMRSVSSMQMERERQRDRNQAAANPGYGYNSSRLPRRTSMSPTSPRLAATAELAARVRQRSPSSGSRRVSDGGDARRQSSSAVHGPISWLRDRFSNSSGSSQPRNERKY